MTKKEPQKRLFESNPPSIKPYQLVLIAAVGVLFTIKFIIPSFETKSIVRPGQVWQHRMLVIPYAFGLPQPECTVTRPCKVIAVRDDKTIVFFQYGDTMELSEEGFLFNAERLR